MTRQKCMSDNVKYIECSKCQERYSANWKQAFRVNGPFQGDLRAVALSLCQIDLILGAKKNLTIQCGRFKIALKSYMRIS